MQQYLQNKKGLVQNVFDRVYNQYDLMNDFMSLGIHRLWKKSLLNMMNPSDRQKLIDVACGTGDIAKLFLQKVNKVGKVFNFIFFLAVFRVIQHAGKRNINHKIVQRPNK